MAIDGCQWYRLCMYLVLVGLLVQLASISANRCLTDRPEVTPKRNFYHRGHNLPIRIETSNRPSHQLVSRILRILLLDVLGYSKVELVNGETNVDATRTLNRFIRELDDGGPETMVNTEVWLPAGFSLEYWLSEHQIINGGPLGSSGRFGWFMSSSVVSEQWNVSHSIADHWRALQLSDMSGVFDLSDKQDMLKYLSRPDVSSSLSYCDDLSSDCHNGFYQSPQCRHQHSDDCAVLLSSYPELYGSELLEQIHILGLRTRVAWIGNHLNTLVRDHFSRNLPVLFFSWAPNTLTSDGRFTRLHFPSCDGGLSYDAGSGCDFEIHQLTKIMWSRLHTHTPEARHLILHLHFSTSDLESLLLNYSRLMNGNSGYSGASVTDDVDYLEEAACSWVRKNENVWSDWLPEVLSSKQVIYLGGLFPIGGRIWRAPSIVPGALMAVEYINRDSSILGDYELKLLVEDTECKVDIAMKHFLHYAVDGEHPVAGILGPGCSEIAEPIAGVSKHFNMVVISYGQALDLANRAMYPLFFRTYPHIVQNGEVYIELFRRWQWKRVALLAADGENFPQYNSFLKDLFHGRSVHVEYDRKMPRRATFNEVGRYIDDLEKKDVKIIILTAYETSARAVLCEAYRRQMTSEYGYVWFLPPWFTERWWNTDRLNAAEWATEKVPCTSAQMLSAVQGHFILTPAYLGEKNSQIVGNCTVHDWMEAYLEHIQALNWEFAAYAAYAYDAVFVFALGLHRLLTEDPSALESIHTDKTVRRFMHFLNNTQFSGASGPVQFAGADRTGIVSIMQFVGNKSQLVGQFSADVRRNASDRMTLQDSSVLWMTKDGLPPSDGTPAPRQCSVEGFRQLLNVECDTAIVVVNLIGVCGFVIMMCITIIIIKRSYDAKMRRFKEKNCLLVEAWPALDKWELQRDQVVLNRRLGEGAFGTVYGGEALISDCWVAVAVKTLKVGSNVEAKLDFLSESEMMKWFDHKNIVKLLGVCTRGEPVYAVMEFMLHGDLKTFLLSRRQMVGQNSKEAEDVSPAGLTQMALDVAYGLQYLSELKYVHRDLACRNCLVHAGKTVKIGDFGMTRPMYDNDYYRFNKRGMFPVRWMAPESLSDGIFRTSSDIWSYGILLYEIMTFGSFPYQGLSNRQVLAFVKSGQHILLPQACPPTLAEVVLSCWQFDATHRPVIDDIISILVKNPTLITPCLDSPSAALVLEGTASLEMSLAPRPRSVRGSNPRRASGDIWTRRGLSLSLSHDDDSKVSSDSPDPAMVSLMDPFGLLSDSAATQPPVPVMPRYCKTTAAPHNRVSFDSRIRTSMFGRSASTDDRRAPTALVVSLGHDADDRCLDTSFMLGIKSTPVVSSTVPLDDSQRLPEPSRPVSKIHLDDDCLAPTSSLESRADSDYCSQHSKDC